MGAPDVDGRLELGVVGAGDWRLRPLKLPRGEADEELGPAPLGITTGADVRRW